ADARQSIVTLAGHTGPVYAVACHPAGKQVVSGGADRVLRVWRLPDGERLRDFHRHAATVNSVAFSRRGARLAPGDGGGRLHAWSTSGDLLRALDAHADAVTTVAFSPDGEKLVSAGHDGVVRVWLAG